MTLAGIVFDMDGTLCLPQTPMFAEMRRALGIGKGQDILDSIYALPEPEQPAAQEKLRAIERRYMLTMEPQPGLEKLMEYVQSRRLRASILTRNFPVPVEHLRKRFLGGYEMDPVITREFRPPKPAPDGLFAIARAWGVNPKDLVMVGDSVDDILAGNRAGATSVLLRNDVNGDVEGADYEINTLPDLIPLLEKMSNSS